MNCIKYLLHLVVALFFVSNACAESVIHQEKSFNFKFDDSVLRITTNKPSDIQHFILHSPERLVVDLKNLMIPKNWECGLKNDDNIAAIRLGRHHDFTRVVLDLKQEVDYQVEKTANTYLVTLKHLEREQNVVEKAVLEDEGIRNVKAPIMEGENSSLNDKKNSVEVNGEKKQNSFIYPHFSINKLVVRMKDKPVYDLFLKNEGDTTFTVACNVLTQDKKPTKDILVTPRFIKLHGKSARKIRILRKERTEDKERVFTLNIAPTHMPQASLDVQIFDEPEKGVEDLTWRYDKQRLIFFNKGNINISLSRLKVCRVGGLANGAELSGRCRYLPDMRIDAGGTGEIALAEDERIELYKQGLANIEKLYLPTSE